MVDELNKNNKNSPSYNYIDITQIVKDNNLYIEKDISMDSFVVDFSELRKYLKKEYTNNSNIVLDGHVSHLLDADYTIVLRCNPEIILERLKNRKYSSNKIKENIEAECLDVCLIESLDNSPKVYEIDTTNGAPIDIVNEIINAIENNLVKKGVVDWLNDYFYMLK
ncbi:adenylate kinase family protein [Methanococcus aeolicus]|uniref:Adenylate kinase n=1 Tax=Methanococcus aeolicus (strain ATCC BAA-1280 / DSM 17508 / OCM 812 / Nankai-3) TaxID=419665 RepID=A6UUA7_META3|nr:AAA family ATPase [Methanococcus aeolicus]ABR56079.1 conserved hypothetical protein [Methanococcus aeolicus Nankai-3]